MAGYILEFKDEFDKKEVLEKLHQMKEDLCDICEMLEDADMEGDPMEEQMSERNRMSRRDGMSNRDGMSSRGGRMRDERMMRGSEGMNYRRGRNGRYM